MLRQLIDNLHTLRLKVAAQAVQDQLNNPAMQSIDCLERLNLILDAEIYSKENKKQNLLLRQAKLKVNACPEDIDYHVSRGLDRSVMAHLITCHYIDSALNVIITGPTGVGKTWLSCALGQAAVRKKYSVFSIRLARLFEEFQIAHGDGTLQKYRQKLAGFKLLILDDWGLAPVTARVRHELLELIDERLDNGSIIITSQLPVEQWHSYLGEATMADAILDRVVQRAHRIELHGESMRKANVKIDGKEVH